MDKLENLKQGEKLMYVADMGMDSERICISKVAEVKKAVGFGYCVTLENGDYIRIHEGKQI